MRLLMRCLATSRENFPPSIDSKTVRQSPPWRSMRKGEMKGMTNRNIFHHNINRFSRLCCEIQIQKQIREAKVIKNKLVSAQKKERRRNSYREVESISRHSLLTLSTIPCCLKNRLLITFVAQSSLVSFLRER